MIQSILNAMQVLASEYILSLENHRRVQYNQLVEEYNTLHPKLRATRAAAAKAEAKLLAKLKPRVF
jgi:hypothetical protein